MSKPDPPTPPNPIATAAAQTGTNVSTGVANAFLNNINQNTPEGSLRYDVTGNFDWRDPSTGQTYNVPRFTSTQTLSPQQEQLRNTRAQTQQNLANMGQQQSARVSGLLSQPFNPSSAPINTQAYLQQMDAGGREWLNGLMQQGMSADDAVRMHYQEAQRRGDYRTAGVMLPGSAEGLQGVGKAATSFDAGGPIQTGFGDAGDVTRSYGPQDDFSSDRQRVEESLMSRMNPQLARERGNIEQRLADQGIRYGSAAYTSAMDDYNRQATDTRFGAIGQAGQEQQRMMDMAAQRAGFQNAAQQQQYEQLQGRASFGNQAQAQQFQQNAALGAFQNAGLAQQLGQEQSIFNAQNAARNQYMQEQYSQRNQPLNEIAALMSGSQVQQPNWLNSPTSQIATTDFAGIQNQNFQNQMGIYNAQSQNANALMGGVLGAGAGLIRSDRRSKEKIDRIGTVFAYDEEAARRKLPVYEWQYKDDPSETRRVGPMAQDVEKIDRGAVHDLGGVKHIEPTRVMGSILRAA